MFSLHFFLMYHYRLQTYQICLVLESLYEKSAQTDGFKKSCWWISLRLINLKSVLGFFHAPNLFVCLREAPKHILFSLLTLCITSFSSYFTQYLTSHLIFVKSCPTISWCFYGQNRSNILQNWFHAVLNNPGSRVGMTAVKDFMFFSSSILKGSLN